MGSLFSMFMDFFSSHTISVMLVGLQASGKTSLAHYIKTGKPLQNPVPTMGYNKTEFKNKNVTIHSWDLAGQSKDQWSEYLSECDVVIFVVDSSDTSKIEEARKELHNFAKNALKDRPTPLLVVSNKIDCEIHYSLKEVLHHLQLNKLHHVQWVLKETSATQGTNVNYVLDWLTKYAKEKDDTLIVAGKQD